MAGKKGRLIFVTGGTRSGKSDFALRLASSIEGKKVYIATAEALDHEMKERILLHRESRPEEFDTVEESKNLVNAFWKIEGHYEVVLLDCLTLWISNVFETFSLKQLVKESCQIIEASQKSEMTVIVVSNELGMGIVPENQLAREFRDVAGKVNQLFAAAAHEAHFVVSGIPIKLK
ncbi:MAG: bifunctional adenosylcobinamide kinase/adenosylcobinamide-phosphate guanylyltransferase [Nitrospinota bacterium]